ncbi:MAG: DUF192 domain-containing protein [Haloferacaceae archaeon]
MNRRTLFAIALLVGLALAGGAVGLGLHERGDYDGATVTIEDGDTGERLAEVRVRVADTWEKRYTGLSDTDELEPNEGMWFVHDDPGEYAYVMREMSFPIDIVFVAQDGTITAIHEAPVEENQSSLTRYTGEGKYVLEVNAGFTDEHGIEVGDRVVDPIDSAEDQGAATEADTGD